MALIDNLGKIYYVPLKNNRLVDDKEAKNNISLLNR